MRRAFMSYYEQCDCCGEKIRFWEDAVLHGKDESHIGCAHRRCHIVYLNHISNISMLETMIESLKGTVNSLSQSLKKTYIAHAVSTAKKTTRKARK